MTLTPEQKRNHDRLGVFFASLLVVSCVAPVVAAKIVEGSKTESQSDGRNLASFLDWRSYGNSRTELSVFYKGLSLPQEKDQLIMSSLKTRVTKSIPMGNGVRLITADFGGEKLAGLCIQTFTEINCYLSSVQEN